MMLCRQEWFDGPADKVGDNRRLYHALLEATAACGATVFTAGKHEFWPNGLSAFVVLGESHTALHTFPEEGKAWVEIVSCTDKIDVEVFLTEFAARSGLVAGTSSKQVDCASSKQVDGTGLEDRLTPLVSQKGLGGEVYTRCSNCLALLEKHPAGSMLRFEVVPAQEVKLMGGDVNNGK